MDTIGYAFGLRKDQMKSDLPVAGGQPRPGLAPSRVETPPPLDSDREATHPPPPFMIPLQRMYGP